MSTFLSSEFSNMFFYYAVNNKIQNVFLSKYALFWGQVEWFLSKQIACVLSTWTILRSCISKNPQRLGKLLTKANSFDAWEQA